MVCHFPDRPFAAGHGRACALVDFDDHAADFHDFRFALARFNHAHNVGKVSANVNKRLFLEF
jgi:hypothetical protein